MVIFKPTCRNFKATFIVLFLDLHTILSIVGPVVVVLQRFFINLASSAEILHICKSAVVKFRRSGEEV